MSCCGDRMNLVEAASCCKPRDTTKRAAQAMRDSGAGCAPVFEDTQSLRLVGVVTERDVCCSVAKDDWRASEVRVEEIMRPASVCCGEREPLEAARRRMEEQQASSLPVVDEEGCCCGTVSVHRVSESQTSKKESE